MKRRSFFQSLAAGLAVVGIGGFAITPQAEAGIFGWFAGIGRRRRRRFRRRRRRFGF